MAPSISADLTRLKNSAERLNKIADQATEQIRALDTYLESVSPGVEVFSDAPIAQGREHRPDQSGMSASVDYDLGYARADDGKWGLVVRASAPRVDNTGNEIRDQFGNVEEWEFLWVRRLDRAAREFRVAALPMLPTLLAELAGKVEATAESATRDLNAVQAVADELADALERVPLVPEKAITHHKPGRLLNPPARNANRRD